MPTDIKKITADLKTKYPDIGIQSIEIDEANGKSTLYLQPTRKALAFIDKNKGGGVTPHLERAASIRRQVLDRSALDLSIQKSPYEQDPKDNYEKSIQYYFEDDIYGSVVDILTNFASKGFENDIDDTDIKSFYDTWNFDVNFHQVLKWVFFDFFRVGMVRTYKIIGKYEAGVTYLSPQPGVKTERSILRNMMARADRINKLREEYGSDSAEFAAKKKVWSKGYMPISYTVLNPTLIEIEGSLLFDKSKITLEASDELKKMLQKATSELTEDEKEIVKFLPSDFKSSVLSSGSIVLDPMFVGSVDYRKQPYERYPRPRGIKAFDSIEYKRALRQADLSTLDGISNYILKITIGNDDYPVTDQSQLEAVASLFDTTSKSFDVVWNHTLQIEKIVSPEIESILGQDKYKQVNEDITGALAFSRALIDGTGSLATASAPLIVRTILEEVNYAREQVARWVYEEYRQIAEAMGFERFPRVRWDNAVLRDIILYLSTISQLVDRRMISYKTAIEEVGFDFDTEFNQMQQELPSVLEGVLGIVGSPFQKSSGDDATNTQDTQKAPTGTPSSGRPKGQTNTKTKNTDTTKKTKQPNQSPSQQPNPTKQAASLKLEEAVSLMSEDDFEEFVEAMRRIRKVSEESS